MVGYIIPLERILPLNSGLSQFVLSNFEEVGNIVIESFSVIE